MAQHISVLMIEDDPDYALLMTMHLNDACAPALTFVMECVDTLRAAEKLLEQKDFDVVLLDLMLPDSQGLETLTKTRAYARDIPIVVMTGLTDEQLGLDAVASGAQDFLVKERFDARLLKRTIGYALERGRLFSQIEAIVSSFPDGMAVIDGNGYVRFVNAAAEAVLGKKAQDLIDQPFGYELQPRRTTELKLAQQDGSERVAEMRVTEIPWKKDKAFLASIRDITERRKLAQLQAEIKERRRVDELKEKFLGVAAHELRSPLTIIKAAVGNLRDGLVGPLASEQAEMVAIANRNLDRLTRITNNLLDLSRLESGRAKVSARPFDLLRLVMDTAQGVGLVQEAGKARVRLDLPAELPQVNADPDMIAQVLNNLLDNALRYAREEIVLRVRVDRDGPIRVSVIDDGPGIPQDKIGELFNKFVQINRAAGGGGYKGTGLGLAICHETLALNKGRIWVESELGKGSQFHFSLPQEVAYASSQKEAPHH